MNTKELNKRVKSWYVSNYPTDDMGEDIYSKVTFRDVLGALDNGMDVYDFIGVYDSVIRERIFERLSILTGLTYNDIYEKWLNA